SDYSPKAIEENRLETVSEKAPLAPFPVTDQDWPTFRRDNARTMVTSHTVPAKVGLKWEYKPVGSLVPTAPVAPAELVFVSGSDGTVRAINAESGKLRWTAYTGGPIKYPPAIDCDRAYVGSGDGWVYCFEAASGRLLWRFRAAPVERVIPVHGTLSSTWPV